MGQSKAENNLILNLFPFIVDKNLYTFLFEDFYLVVRCLVGENGKEFVSLFIELMKTRNIKIK